MEQNNSLKAFVQQDAAAVQGAIWPPPPMTGAEPNYYRFSFLYKRDSQNVADFREGDIGLDPDGVTLRGKCVPRAEIYIPVMILSFLLMRLFCFIPHLIMRYGMLKYQECRVAWDQVRRVVLVPGNRQACIVYDAPNLSGTEKTFCLAFTLPPGVYESFVDEVNSHAPGRAYAGKIRPGTSPVLSGLLILFVIMLASIVAITAIGSVAGH